MEMNEYKYDTFSLCFKQEDEPNAGPPHDQAGILRSLMQKFKKLPWKPEVEAQHF